MAAAVVFNALALRPGGAGVSTYIRGLLGAMRARTSVELAAVVQEDAAAELPAGIAAHPVPPAEGVRRALAGLRTAPAAELTHALNVTLPLRARGAKVSTVHDLAYFDRPQAVSALRARTARLLWARSLRAADTVIAVSGFTADRLRARFGVEAVVVPEGVDPSFRPPSPAEVDSVRRRYDLPETFVLHVGTIEPRKDIPGLVAASGQAGLELVLAGARWGSPTPLAARLLGFVPAADLPALYGAATVVAYPSRYEGFGLPPLEAMACGAAVVASRIPPLEETLGDAAVLVPPGDVVALAAALGELVADGDRRRTLAAAGRARAASYTWARAVSETVAVYRALGVGI